MNTKVLANYEYSLQFMNIHIYGWSLHKAVLLVTNLTKNLHFCKIAINQTFLSIIYSQLILHVQKKLEKFAEQRKLSKL